MKKVLLKTMTTKQRFNEICQLRHQEGRFNIQLKVQKFVSRQFFFQTKRQPSPLKNLMYLTDKKYQ